MAGLVPAIHAFAALTGRKDVNARDKRGHRAAPLSFHLDALSCCAALIFAVSTLLPFSAPARADPVEDFYRGKTINMIIGYGVGGGYDLYGRLVARHIGKHIPGMPNVVPQNMTGAGSLRAAQYLYSVAPKDGTVIGTFGRTIVTMPLLTPQAPQFDGTKFTWLGSATNEVSSCITWHSSPVKIWDDILHHQITFAGEGPGADPDIYSLLYKNVFGAKIKLVTGYSGTNDATLAMERGEVEGLCGMSWSTLKSRHLKWMKDKTINIIVQAALKKQPELADVPLASELTQDPEKLQILKLFLATQEIARPFAAPPDIPADRKAALVAAFEATMKDIDFRVDANKLDIDIKPLGGKAVEQLVRDLYATPKPILEKAALAVSK
jgi:tripartite-type tricarboxylate transporter receptor subunit TctC